MTQTTVLYITPALAVGGAEKFLVLLSDGLTGETRKQTVVSLSENNPLRGEFSRKIDFYCMPRASKFDTNAIFKLRRLIKAENPDIAVCLNFFSYIFFRFAIVGLGNHSKRIISYHSTIHLNRKEHLLHRLYATVLTKRDMIITVSRNQAAYTSKRYGIPMKLFKTIYNGIDTARWTLPASPAAGKDIRSRFHLPEDAQVIILTAAFRPEKKHVNAIKALHTLHHTHNCKAYLLLVGDGILVDDIRIYTNSLGMESYVRFAGIQEDVRPFYWASDLFTLCSDSETFSIAAMEAMACGLPAVLTDVGGANEMIIEDFNGYLCKRDPEDIAAKWNKALHHEFSKTEISKYIDTHFNKHKMIDEYKKTFEEIVNDMPGEEKLRKDA